MILGAHALADLGGIDRRDPNFSEIYSQLKKGIIPDSVIYKKVIERGGIPRNTRTLQLVGEVPRKSKGNFTGENSNRYDRSRYIWLLDAPFSISNRCCAVMKKEPAKKFSKESGRRPMTGQLAAESALRTANWIKYGCNGFDMKTPISNPMAFWTDQDILQYIKEFNLPIASVYGDIVFDDGDELSGQMDIAELGLAQEVRKLKTTGCNRTGCMFCGYGCHLEKESRFEMTKMTHPKQYEYIMRDWEKGGLGYKKVIDWLNENSNGKINIKY